MAIKCYLVKEYSNSNDYEPISLTSMFHKENHLRFFQGEANVANASSWTPELTDGPAQQWWVVVYIEG